MASFSDPGKLKRIRKALGVSQTALSWKSGVDRALIANVETGRHSLSSHHAIKIYDALSSVEKSRGIQSPKNEANKVLVEVLYCQEIWDRERATDAERALQRANTDLVFAQERLAQTRVALGNAVRFLSPADGEAAKEQAQDWNLLVRSPEKYWRGPTEKRKRKKKG